MAVLARAKARRQSKLNAAPEGAVDTGDDADKALVSKASSTGKSE